VYVDNSISSTVSIIATAQHPSNITITSAVDGNGNPVQNGNSTTSTSIAFTVQTTAGSNVAGLQCSIDGGQFNKCTTNNQNQISIDNLTSGRAYNKDKGS